MIYLILFLLSIVFPPQTSTQVEDVIYTYEWKEVPFKADFITNNRLILINGNGYYRIRKEKIWVIAFDTLPIEIKIIEPINDTIKLIEKINYKAMQDAYFDKAWDTLKVDEIPTPFTKQQAKAFKNYKKAKVYQLIQQKSPAFSVQSIYGDPYTQDSLLNKVTLINFWFYGCLPCMAEIPALNEVAAYYKDNPKVQLLSFFGDSIYIDEMGIPNFQAKGSSIIDGVIQPQKHYPIDLNFTQIPNSEKERNTFNIVAYPTNILIDKKGMVQEIFIGASAEIEDNNYIKSNLIHKINMLLEDKP